MSELTFDIADYRPLLRAQTHDRGQEVEAPSGLVLMSSNSEPRGYDSQWLEAKPAVVDIRTVREAHRAYPRRGKILRFSNPASHGVYIMPAHDSHMDADEDPGPLVA